MAYELANDVPKQLLSRMLGGNSPSMEELEAQAVYRLDNGDLVAMNFSTKALHSNHLSCRVVAWLVDEQGDVQGQPLRPEQPILIDYKHTAHPLQVLVLGTDGLATQLRNLVLGEAASLPEYPAGAPDPNEIPWSQELRDNCNIRYAIALARASGEIVDLQQLA